ncbi:MULTISPECIES: hypothetical protein [unclassified Curtobacterium]|uniref:hypothetical protein n=1 Tax=unclassified Curtobacterium TaxID=257496 RepID=UPI0039B0CF8B
MTTADHPRRRPTTAVWALLVAVAAGLLAWIRIGSTARGVAWAEDSGRFLTDRLTFGPVRSVWHPYDGYLHVLPRLVVDAAVALGRIDLYALSVSVMSCAVLGAVCGTVFVLARGVVRAWPLRVLLAAVPALVPLAPVEIAGTAANLHWYLLFAAPWLLAHRPRSWWSSAWTAVAVAVVTTSEIQAAVFLPLLLLGRRQRRVIPVAAVAVLGVAAQVTAALTHPRSATHQGGITSFRDMTAGFVAQVVGGSGNADVRAVGASVSAHGWWVVTVPAVLLVVAVVAALVLADWRTGWMLLAVSVGAGVVWYAALIVNRTPGTTWSSFTPAAWAGTAPLRYAAASSMFLTAAVVLAADVFLARARWSWRAAGGVLVVASVVAFVAGAGAVPLREHGPQWSAEIEHRASYCAAHPGDSVRVGAMPRIAGWDATVPCAMVERAVGR